MDQISDHLISKYPCYAAKVSNLCHREIQTHTNNKYQATFIHECSPTFTFNIPRNLSSPTQTLRDIYNHHHSHEICSQHFTQIFQFDNRTNGLTNTKSYLNNLERKRQIMNLHPEGSHFENQRVNRSITIKSFKDYKMSIKSLRFTLKKSFSINFQFKGKQQNIFTTNSDIETTFCAP